MPELHAPLCQVLNEKRSSGKHPVQAWRVAGAQRTSPPVSMACAHSRLYEGEAPKRNLCVKGKPFILTCLTSAHHHGTLRWRQCAPRAAFPLPKQLPNSVMWPRKFGASAVFCFASSTSAKWFPFEGFFTRGNKKKSLGAKLGDEGGWGMGVMPVWVRNC